MLRSFRLVVALACGVLNILVVGLRDSCLLIDMVHKGLGRNEIFSSKEAMCPLLLIMP